MERKIIAVVENHFDQLWRRCFERDLVSKGKNYVSYSKIEQYYIEENVKLCEKHPEYKFQIETPCAVETYLKNFPEKADIIKKLYKNGNLRTPNTGYLIIDSNMIGEEAIIRNFILSEKFFEKYASETPGEACRSDAFGNSAQLPQILKNFGAKHVREIFYVPYTDDVWVGLDGTPICVKKHEFLGMGGGWSKYAPCTECNGFGKTDGGEVCPVCNGRGINEEDVRRRWTNVFTNDAASASGTIQIGGEEFLPQEKTLEQIAQIREQKGIDIYLGFEEEMLEIYKNEIDKVERGDFSGLKVRESREFNPCNTGCLTTRIRTKQGLSDIENRLLACETLSALEYTVGKKNENYDDAWKKFMLCAFHDSVTGTMVDAPYAELLDWHEELRALSCEKYLQSAETEEICIYNPSSFTRSGIYESDNGKLAIVNEIKPYSFEKVRFEAPAVRMNEKPQITALPKEAIFTGQDNEESIKENGERFFIENDRFVIEADNKGLCAISDKRLGAVSVMTENERPFEFVLESDYGSPWATLEPPYHVYPLKDRTRFVAMEKGEKFTKLIYRTDTTMHMCEVCNPTTVTWSVTLIDGYDRIKFDANVFWSSVNKRLRVRFPVPMLGRDIYGIPGGYLEREPYEPIYSWSGSNGDWAAYRFGGIEGDKMSVALFNRGTPSYRILKNEKGDGKTLAVSLLRSPYVPTYLHEPFAYSMTDWDGMRDEGNHSFSFELAAYDAPFASSDAVRDAESFARPFLSVKAPISGGELPYVISGSATVSHCKIAEDENGIIARIVENGGKDTSIVIRVPSGVKAVYRTDMPERKSEKLELSETLRISLKAFEIASLRFVY